MNSINREEHSRSLFIFSFLVLINLIATLSSKSSILAILQQKFPLNPWPIYFWVLSVSLVVIVVTLILWRHRVSASHSPSISVTERTHRNQIELFLLVIMFLVLVANFFIAFPPALFDEYIYHGDFPYQYYVSFRNISHLMTGDIFGWESSFLGGYPTFLDFSKDLSPLIFPLVLLFSDPVAFHLFLMILFFSLPICFKYWAEGYLDDVSMVQRSCLIFLLFLIMNARNLLNGMVTALAGLALFFLISLLFRYISERKTGVLFPLAILLGTLQLHIHASFFMLTMFFIMAESLYKRPDKAQLRLLFLYFGLQTLAIFPYLWWHLQVSDLSIPTSKLAEEGFLFSFNLFIRHLFQPYTWFEWGTYGLSLMFFLAGSFVKPLPVKVRFISMMGFFAVLLTALKTAEIIGFALSRNDYLLMPLASVSGGFLISHLSNRKLMVAFVILIFLFSATYLPFPLKISHRPLNYLDSLKNFSGIEGDERILAENPARWNAAVEGYRSVKSPLPHYIPYFENASGLPLLSNPGADPYHYSVYRFNTITSGTFRGKPLWQTGIIEFTDHLSQWRVRWLAVWSLPAINYLQQNQDYFTYEERVDDLRIYRFKAELAPIIRNTAANHESCSFNQIDKNTFEVKLHNVPQGTKLIINMNYSRLWKARCDQQEVKLLNIDGQLGFINPNSDHANIHFRFPTFSYLFLLTLLSVGIALIISRKITSKS